MMQPWNIFDTHVIKPIDYEEDEPFQQYECNAIDIDDTNNEFGQPLIRTNMDNIMIDANAIASIKDGLTTYNNKDSDKDIED